MLTTNPRPNPTVIATSNPGSLMYHSAVGLGQFGIRCAVVALLTACSPTGLCADAPVDLTLEHLADHIDHICQLTGDCQHVAIGSDLDGGFGREMAPIDYDTIADLQRFLDILVKRGYSTQDISAIAHGNLLRFFRQAWS